MPLLALAHAAKKVLPSEYHDSVDAAELGRLLGVWRKGAVPHGDGGASLFAAASRLTRDTRPGRANCRVRCYVPPGGGGWCCSVVADVAVGEGDAVVLPDMPYEPPQPQQQPQQQQQQQHLDAAGGDCGCAPPAHPYTYGELKAMGGVSGAPRPPPLRSADRLALPLEPPGALTPAPVPGRGDAEGRVAFTIDGVFSPAECRQLERLAFDGWDNTLRYRQMLKTGPEENYRLLRAGSDVHEAIWHRIRPFCPARWRGWQARGLNDRMRFIQYDPGERFVAHTDGEYGISDGTRKGWRSFITVQVYLNGYGLSGGSTRFLQGDEALYDCVPRPGKLLIFEHCMRHTGE